jgi:hypothetical protein
MAKQPTKPPGSVKPTLAKAAKVTTKSIDDPTAADLLPRTGKPGAKVGKAIPKAKPKMAAVAEEDKPVRQFQVAADAAHHTEADGTVYQPGEVVETTVDLAATFPNKFKEVKDGKYVGDGEIPAPKKRFNADNTTDNDHGHGPVADDDNTPESDVPVDDENDVTSELFPEAVELNMRVFSVEDGYEVRDETDAVVNTDPLTTKEDVRRFLGIEEAA